MKPTEKPPPWCVPDEPESNFHYGPEGECWLRPLVIYPSYDTPGAITLDGTFTARQLRDLADWIEKA